MAIRGYGPFGENGTTAPNRFGYTGQQYIAGLGLYYYKVKWYSPTMGRFLETDPIGYGDGVNWYAYVGNIQVNRKDSTGFYWFQQDWQAAYPIVGRFDSLIEPGGSTISARTRFILYRAGSIMVLANLCGQA
ncbi:MAG: RHS repeat-associated core domain-containing protein [Candidatus Nitrotoga sp.]|nr:RHS repeat-associated core domain-containing protein [Candidatus Nitrotoga sp.]